MSPDAAALPDVIVPASFNFPHSGKLLSISFVLFAGWFADAVVSLADYPRLALSGLVTFFGSLNAAVPFLLDLFRIPADTFQLFLATGVINSRVRHAAGGRAHPGRGAARHVRDGRRLALAAAAARALRRWRRPSSWASCWAAPACFRDGARAAIPQGPGAEPDEPAAEADRDAVVLSSAPEARRAGQRCWQAFGPAAHCASAIFPTRCRMPS